MIFFKEIIYDLDNIYGYSLSFIIQPNTVGYSLFY
jgi:hypothetical protein